MASFTAAGTSYATRGVPMVPFFIFYSMFGFQRVGDLIWAAADARARGFLLGATAGRTTLLGEGLQHQDGHSLVLASTVPTCQAYDPAFAYEMAAIVRHGIDRMYGAGDAATGRRLLLPHPLQRELRDAADGPTASTDGHHRAACTAGPTRPTASTADGHDPVLGLGAERGPRRPGRAGRALRRRRRAVEATSYKRLREEALATRALEPPAPRRAAPHAARHRAARRAARARSSRSPTS